MVCCILAFASACVSPGRKTDSVEDPTLQLHLARFSGDVFVHFSAASRDYRKLAVMPFKAAVELAGASMSDVFTTELLKTAKYNLIERGQIESVLKEQEFGMTGVIDDDVAVRVGRILGVQGVVVGTVSEYGYQKAKVSRVPSIGLSVRMIDTTTGEIVWSVTHSAVCQGATSLSQHAETLVEEMVVALAAAWVDAGDATAAGLPPPRGLKAEGGVREVHLSWSPHNSLTVAGYEVLRKNPRSGVFESLIKLKNTREPSMRYADEGLLDLTLYAYRVRTVSRYGLASEQAVDAEAITLGKPLPPSGFDAESGGIRSVALKWAPSADPSVTGYVVTRQSASEAPVVVGRVAGRELSSLVDRGPDGRGLGDGESFAYRVASLNKAEVESDAVGPVTAVTRSAPRKAAGVRGRSGMPASAEIAWQANPVEEEVESYNIYRAAGPDEDAIIVGTARGAGATSYVDGSGRGGRLDNGSTYHYRVSAVNIGGVEGALSDPVAVTTKPAPRAVQGLTASSGSVRSVRLEWKRSPESDIVSYKVYRAAGTHGRYLVAGTTDGDACRFDDAGLSDGAAYRYAVAAVDRDDLEGAMSDPVETSTKPAPQAPQNVVCADGADGVAITWDKSPEPDVEKYRVYRHAFISSRQVGETGENRFVVTDVSAGSTCKFSVSAVDRDGLESARSVPVRHVMGR